MNLDTQQQHRVIGGIQHGDRFVDGFRQGGRVNPGLFGLLEFGRGVRWNRCVNAITRNFDVDRSSGFFGDREYTRDFAGRGAGVVEHALCRGDFAKHPHLGTKVAHLVVQLGVSVNFADTGSTADDNHRRALCIGLRGRIDQLQSTDAVSHRNHPKTAHPRVGIRSESRTLFVAGIN